MTSINLKEIDIFTICCIYKGEFKPSRTHIYLIDICLHGFDIGYYLRIIDIIKIRKYILGHKRICSNYYLVRYRVFILRQRCQLYNLNDIELFI